jgi:hypothetical protein
LEQEVFLLKMIERNIQISAFIFYGMMQYIFMDESGDLGLDFSKIRTSRYFMVTFLLVSNKKPLDKIVKKIFFELNNGNKKRS